MFHFKSSLRAFQTSNYLPLQLELQYNVLLPPNAKESRWTPLIPAATYTTSSSPRRVPMNYSTFVVTMLDSWSGGSPDIARFCNDERGGNDKPELCIFAILVLGMKARWGLISKGGRYSTFVGVVGTWASISKWGTSRWQWAESYKIRARDETVLELRDRLACIVLNVRYAIKVPRMAKNSPPRLTGKEMVESDEIDMGKVGLSLGKLRLCSWDVLWTNAKARQPKVDSSADSRAEI